MVATREEIELFLATFNEKSRTHGGIYFVKRDINIAALADLGLDIQSRREIVDNISIEQYVKGPERDDNGSEGEIWTFGKQEESFQIYIKLKLNDTCAKCLSFHRAEHLLTFPHLR